MNHLLMPLSGGLLIGIAVTIMLLYNGRVTGISGIVSGLILFPKKESFWRVTFILGLFAGGLILRILNPNVFANTSGRSLGIIALAGFLVGFGTVMGGGCTSGHGVCGVSRLSLRSILATMIFIFFGFISVAVVKHFFRYL